MTPAATAAVNERCAPWPYAELDITGLRAGGWRPIPVRELVLKVHQRCNLSCDYCYMYTLEDQSWRDRPKAMSADVRQAAVASLARHVQRHNLTRVRVVLHGGEPLLFGPARIGQLAAEVRSALPAGCCVDIGLQTNGMLLNERMMAVLREHRISVGLSVDGPASTHDLHRRSTSGRTGSFAGVRSAAELLRRPENRGNYAGVLCVVNSQSDPIACFDQLLEFEPPMIDFLLPHANWQRPPSRSDSSPTPYADWLIAAFDAWQASARFVRVKFFEDIIGLLLQRPSRSEQVGLSPSAVVVIETDGAIEQVDALKSAYAGACATGLDVRRHELDDALHNPGIVARQIGRRALSDDCHDCPVATVCGGGHYAHRYDPRTGFRNRTVYCADMRRLIDHVRDVLLNHRSRRAVTEPT
jgi:uncharacterized protein